MEYEVFTIAGIKYVSDLSNQARLYHPLGAAVDSDGTIVITDSYNNKIKRIDKNWNVSSIAGIGYMMGDRDGPGNQALFSNPTGIAIDSNGTIIFADTMNNKIKGITREGNVFTIAGTGEQGDKDGYGDEAILSGPTGIVIDYDGTIIFADTNNNKIKGIDGNNNVFTIAGNRNTGDQDGPGDQDGSDDQDGPGDQARFNAPRGVAIKSDGTIIVADTFNNKIKGIDRNNNVFTITGTTERGDQDGHVNEARFSRPYDVIVDPDDTIILSDLFNLKIKAIDRYDNVFTIAGTGERGDKDGLGHEATFNNPYGISIDFDGTIIVADTDNNKIKAIRPVKLTKSAVGY